tara:strand:- start:653 stop:1990 length:1338 start_codon:yes stop_codon:yes gene_type:complete
MDLNIDLNIDNYTILELMMVLKLSDDPTQDEVMEKSQELIDKFIEDKKIILADFFTKARDKVLEYVTTLDEWDEQYKVLLQDQLDLDCETDRNILYKTEKEVIKYTNCKKDINPQYKNVMNRMVVVNSEFIESSNKSDFTFDLSVPINDVISISLYSFHIPYTWYKIDKAYGTNFIKIDDEIIEIESGNYNNVNICSTLNDALFTKNSTCMYNSISGKVSLSFPKEVESVTFYVENSISKTNNNLGYTLGFRQSVYNRPSDSHWEITGEAVCNVIGTKFLQLMVDEYSKNRLNTNILNMVDNMNPIIKPQTNYNHTIERNQYNDIVETEPRTLTKSQIQVLTQIESDNEKNTTFTKTTHNGPSDIFAVLPTKHHNMTLGDMCLEFGGTMQNNKRVYFGPVTISRMRIRLLDDKGNTINLNGNDWSFTLLCETLYQGTQKKLDIPN